MLSNMRLSRLGSYADKIIGDHLCGFCLTDRLLIGFFSFIRYWGKMGVQ
jgi:hypothetical protein